MTANIINMLTVMAGSLIGMMLKKGIPQKIINAVMTAIGVCTVYIGITGAMCDVNILIIIASMIVGTIIGTAARLDDRINSIGVFIEEKFKSKGEKGMTAKGFVTASLLFCIGSMTVTGALQAGISGDSKLIITKSILDFMSSMMLASTFGIGVFLASFFVLVFQGALTIFSGFLIPFLSTGAINAMTATGSLITLMLGLNLMNISKIKVADYLPSIIVAPLAYNIYRIIVLVFSIFVFTD